MEQMNTDNAELEEVSEGVYLGDFLFGERASMKYWRIEPGATLPQHRHTNEQIGFLIEGELTAVVEGEEYSLYPGDGYRFASNELHGATNPGDEPAIGLGVLSPPRKNPDWRTVDPHGAANEDTATTE